MTNSVLCTSLSFFWGWKESVIGKNIVDVKIFGEKQHNNNIGLEDGICAALFTLKEGFEDKMTKKTKEIFCAENDELSPEFKRSDELSQKSVEMTNFHAYTSNSRISSFLSEVTK
jgi:hypothetical protein